MSVATAAASVAPWLLHGLNKLLQYPHISRFLSTTFIYTQINFGFVSPLVTLAMFLDCMLYNTLHPSTIATKHNYGYRMITKWHWLCLAKPSYAY